MTDKIEEKAEKELEAIKEAEIVDLPKRETFAEKAKRLEKEKLASWVPKTKLGKEVKDKKIKDIDYILDNNLKILEEQIVDTLVNVKSDLLSMGQAKGKFGGGKRRAWRQTQKKTAEGNIPTFSCMCVAGNNDGYVSLGYGKVEEIVREIRGGLASACTYVGASRIKDLPKCASFVRCTRQENTVFN